MDDALRNAIWNALHTLFGMAEDSRSVWFWAAQSVAQRVLKMASDTPEIARTPESWLRKVILTTAEWYDVYNILEQLAGTINDGHIDEETFTRFMNFALEEELAGYRFIGGVLTPISDELERDAIESALATEGERFKQAREHLQTALALLGKKPKPDHRNSMKESISAVESAVRSMPGINESNFRNALRKLAPREGIHPVLESAFIKLYEYTSAEGGVRHAMIEAATVGFAEAKFLLVVSSAFVNFLVTKSDSSDVTKRKQPARGRSTSSSPVSDRKRTR